MRAFAEAWPEGVIVQPPVAQLPWDHQTVLLNRLQNRTDRLWYAAKAVEHGWSRNVLALQIESGLHTRQGKAVSNFKATFLLAQSDLAQGITKDPYLFDFLTLRDDANERALEGGLLAQVEKFLMGLGAGRHKNRVIAEYALRDLSKPIGISGYVTKLVESLPKTLQGAIPSVAELEKGLATD